MFFLLLFLLVSGDSLSVYLVSHGWHVSIIVPTETLTEEDLPVLRDFPGARYLEIGWGDAAFYRAPNPTIWMALKAALLPTFSVLHVVGLPDHPRRFFRCAPLLHLRLSSAGFHRLVAYLRKSFLLDETGYPVRMAEGLYGHSYFYPSTQTYHLLRTCNVWVAEALRYSGLPLRPSQAITVAALWHQLRPIARRLPPKAGCPSR